MQYFQEIPAMRCLKKLQNNLFKNIRDASKNGKTQRANKKTPFKIRLRPTSFEADPASERKGGERRAFARIHFTSFS